MELCEPSRLARLPRVGLVDQGITQFAQVYGVSQGLKRKRHEVCAAVDGNSINIVEVVNGKTLCSFPVPPDAKFLCPPCSSRSKSAKKTFLRRTYGVLLRRDEVSVQCYIEETGIESTAVRNSSSKLEGGHGGILLLQSSSDDKEVLVLQEDGTTTVLADNTSVKRSQFRLEGQSVQLQILAGYWQSLEEATQSVLRSRGDVATVAPTTSSVLTAVYKSHSEEQMRLGVWIVPSTAVEEQSPLKPSIDFTIPSHSSGPSKNKVRLRIVQNGARLMRETANTITVFDLTTVTPRNISERHHLTPGELGSLDLSDNLVLTSSNSALNLQNLKYRASLATVGTENTSLKRKRNGALVGGPLSLIAYFPQLKRAVGNKGNQIWAIDIRTPADAGQNLRQSSLLIGNIGRGSTATSPRVPSKIHTTKIGVPLQQEPKSADWESKVESLNQLASSGQHEQFEREFTSEISNDKTILPQNATAVTKFKLDYLISKLFGIADYRGSYSANSSLTQLRLLIRSPGLLDWAAQNGLLANYRLEQALESCSGLDNRRKIDTGAVPHALIEGDESLDLLQGYLQHAPYLQPRELAVTVRALLRKALVHATKSNTNAALVGIANEKAQVDSTTSLIPGVDMSSTTETVPFSLGRSLRATLIRLAQSGQSNVLGEMRSLLDQRDILTLIQFLRQQLFIGGYIRLHQFSSFPSPPPSSDGKLTEEINQQNSGNTTMPLKEIVLLLTCCVDTIGAFGLHGQNDDEEFMKTLIPNLLSEISSASTALEETVYMQGLLRETLRYADSVQKQPAYLKAGLELKQVGTKQSTGKVLTLFSESDPLSTSMVNSALPLSLRVNNEVNEVKIRKGGGQSSRRSAREMGILQDRQRSAYTFERLIL